MQTTINIGDALEEGSAVLQLPQMSGGEFWEFCRRNPDLNVERNAQGDLILMAPTGGETGHRNIAIARYVDEWAERDGSGVAFDSSTLFHLPSGADRSPDAAWVLRERWEALSQEERERIPPICPDFVVELRSPSDSLPDLQNKMEEYLTNGVRLGWLIDPKTRRAYIYRPGQPVQELQDPAEISGDPELPGFTLRTVRIFF